MTATEPVPPLSLWRLFLLHLKLGNTVFGGGDPTLAALHSEIVKSRRWISRERYAVVFALARITPGTNLLAFCAGLSWELKGWAGAITSLLAMTAPTALVVVFLTHQYGVWKSNQLAMAGVGAVMAAAVGMMAAAGWQLAEPYMDKRRGIYAAIFVVAAIALSVGLGLSPIQILALGAAAGYVCKIPG